MLEQFPKSHEHDPAHDAEIHEHYGEQFENTGREGASNASFVLIGPLVAALGASGCDMEKIVAPESQTEIITVSKDIEKKFEHGTIRFNECAPKTEVHEGKKIEIGHSFILIQDAEQENEEGVKPYYGARFIKERPENSETTFIAVNFFADDPKIYEEPCVMRRIHNPEEEDRYAFLIKQLNIRINVLNALKQTPGADEELGAVRAHVEEFSKLLDKEFPNMYDRHFVEEALL